MKSTIRNIASTAVLPASTLLGWLQLVMMATVAIMLLGMTSCKDSELWDDVPKPIADFINRYYPFSELNSVTHSSSAYHIRLDDGPGMTFGEDYAWEAIDGYGLPLPQVLLFDQLPPKMYDYLQATEQLNDVFAITHDKDVYTATLLNDTLTYRIADESLTTRSPSPAQG